MKNNKDIELRSEEVQEVMGQVPAWIVRWGITLLFLVVVALLVGSCFFKYPDVITADMTLTGQHPATAVVTRAAGKIQELLVRDNRPVTNPSPCGREPIPPVIKSFLPPLMCFFHSSI